MSKEERVTSLRSRNSQAENGEERLCNEDGISGIENGKLDTLDGGRAWLMAIGAMFSHFGTWGTNAAYGIFLNFYMSHKTFEEATDIDYALIGSIVVFLGQFLAPWVSIAVNLFSTRTVIGVGVIFQTLGFLLASFATKLCSYI